MSLIKKIIINLVSDEAVQRSGMLPLLCKDPSSGPGSHEPSKHHLVFPGGPNTTGHKQCCAVGPKG